MTLPFFYIGCYHNEMQLELDEDTSRHVSQVLRMKRGAQLNLTEGKGLLLTCEIREAGKKTCLVEVMATSYQQPSGRKVSIAISLLKNPGRFEWFLEKATELGIQEIIPMICERTEKEKIRYDRMNAICVSAMLQSQQCWLPVLQKPVEFDNIVPKIYSPQKFIAHCDERQKKSNLSTFQASNFSTILIGPEGDFTSRETELALQNGFLPVSLGTTRLRTETAGITAAVLLLRT